MSVTREELWSDHVLERLRISEVERDALEARVRELEAGLRDALDEMADMIPYVGEYFVNKHGYADAGARLRKLLPPQHVPAATQPREQEPGV